MTEELITQIVRDIINEAILENWLFYALFFQSLLIGTALGSFTVNFF